MGNRLSYPSVDLSGKVAVVTGGNTGIGYETAKALAEMGAHTFIACRSRERAAAAVERMKQEVGEEKELKVEYLLVDLASFSSVKDFVRTFKEKNLPLHILINNAAVCGTPFSKTEDGFDLQFQVNHLSPVLLTLELLPKVLEVAETTGDGRVVFVSSEAHRIVKWDPLNFSPDSDEGYARFKMYGWTKLYNVMSTFVLQRKLKDHAVTLYTLHPGYIQTDLKRGFGDKKFLSFLNNLGQVVLAKNRQEGAATSVNCVVNPELNIKEAFYYSDCRRKECNPDSLSETYQQDMWSRTIDFIKDQLSPEALQKYGTAALPADQTETPTQGIEVGEEEEEESNVEEVRAEQEPAKTASQDEGGSAAAGDEARHGPTTEDGGDELQTNEGEKET